MKALPMETGYFHGKEGHESRVNADMFQRDVEALLELLMLTIQIVLLFAISFGNK